MTPDQRLNQIEPELAEVLQKVDRLIEGQGQLIELSTSAKAELEQVKAELSQMKATGAITATGLAKLTLIVNDIQSQINQRFDRSEQTQADDLKAGLTQLESNQGRLESGQARLERNQEEILTILRDRLR